MTISLRNSRNKTIIMFEVWSGGDKYANISSRLDISNYSELLLNNRDDFEMIVNRCEQIQGIKGWYWYRAMELKEDISISDLEQKAKSILSPLADKLKLNIVVD